ncbi:hypothetical protein Gotur_019859 [Gossypium turneri]
MDVTLLAASVDVGRERVEVDFG